jgi:hypothetical protein
MSNTYGSTAVVVVVLSVLQTVHTTRSRTATVRNVAVTADLGIG